MRRRASTSIGLCAAWVLVLAASARSQTNSVDFGFDRIVHGWTNYSTAFTITDDLDEYATVGSVFTPAVDVEPAEFSVIVIWDGTGGQRLDFANFTYRILVWSSVSQFIRDPRTGDFANFNFPAPTAGSLTVPDATTRGGRAAYWLRFDLRSTPVRLAACHEYVIGFAAIAATPNVGELFVPTAPTQGPSDLQAGNLVPFGFTQLINAGGLTIYWGQLAMALRVEPKGEPPPLSIRPVESKIELAWPASLECYGLEACENLSAPAWETVGENPVVENGWNRVVLPVANDRWFRLKKRVEIE